MKRWWLGFALLFAVGAGVPPVMAQVVGPMDNARLDKLIRDTEGIEGNIESQPGYWLFEYAGRQIYIVTDEAADRMRILAPITAAAALSQEELVRAMQANFDTALDARYAVAKGVLWSAFIHPLSSLGDAEFRSALRQVATLAATYGSTFSSSGLRFRGGDTPQDGGPRIEEKGKTF